MILSRRRRIQTLIGFLPDFVVMLAFAVTLAWTWMLTLALALAWMLVTMEPGYAVSTAPRSARWALQGASDHPTVHLSFLELPVFSALFVWARAQARAQIESPTFSESFSAVLLVWAPALAVDAASVPAAAPVPLACHARGTLGAADQPALVAPPAVHH